MAVRKIETTISLDGEQQFKSALSSATREMRVMESELRAVSAAYDTNGNAAQFFAAKQQNLRNQIAQQREIVESLERAVKDAGDAYGESSSQVDAYAIRLNNARTRLSRLEQQLSETDSEMEELGRDSVRAGRQLEEGISDGAEAASNSLESLINNMQQDISSIRTSSAVSAVTGLWDMATGAYNAVAGFVEGTVEYRRQLSFLKQNAETNGFDFDLIKSQLIEVTALTGDSSAAIEGLSNLMATGADERQMAAAIDALAGAVIAFPETMKFESLADSLQETIATGSATGQFGELLGRMGVDIEAFNTALAESDSAAGDLDIALAYLAAGGMRQVYEQWQDTNDAMSDAAQTKAALEMELAEFAGTLEKYVTAPVEQVALEAMSYINDIVELAEEKGAQFAADKVIGDASQKAAEVTAHAVAKAAETEIGQTVLPGAIERIQEAEGDVKKAAGNWLLDNTVGDIWDGFYYMMHDAGLGGIMDWMGLSTWKNSGAPGSGKEGSGNITQEGQFPTQIVIDTETAIPGTGMTGEEAGKEAGTKYGEAFGEAYMDFVDNEFPQLPNPLDNISPAQTMLDYMGVTEEWTNKLNEISDAAESASTGMTEKGAAMGRNFADGVMSAEGEVMQAGEQVSAAAEEGASSASGSGAYAAGSNIGAQLAAGLLSQVGYVYSASSRLGAAATSGIGSSGMRTGAVAGGSSVINAVLNIDGKSFARATAPYLSNQMAIRA